MRVLHVNKFAEVAGGVETHVSLLMRQQRELGDEVQLFSSADVPGPAFSASPSSVQARMRSAKLLLWSRGASHAIRRRLEAFRPDVVHFHGIYHQLSPSVMWEVRRRGIASVMTLHDYKLAAPCYLLVREGRECVECVGRRFPAPAVEHRCVKGSRAASILCATEHVLHRPLYANLVDLFVVPSTAANERIASARVIDADRVRIVPHGVESQPAGLDQSSTHTFLYLGRLSPEKGVTLLVNAWRRVALPDPWRLDIGGTGPASAALLESAPAGIRFLGHLSREQTVAAIHGAAVVVAPSLVAETFGLSIAEAMAAARPVLVSDVGNLPHLVGDAGYVVRAGDEDAWVEALRSVASDEVERARRGTRGRDRIESQFSPRASEGRLRAVYLEAIEVRTKGPCAAHCG
jgi:glycosyltransferase involved in cell wall biosynthesis